MYIKITKVVKSDSLEEPLQVNACGGFFRRTAN